MIVTELSSLQKLDDFLVFPFFLYYVNHYLVTTLLLLLGYLQPSLCFAYNGPFASLYFSFKVLLL